MAQHMGGAADFRNAMGRDITIAWRDEFRPRGEGYVAIGVDDWGDDVIFVYNDRAGNPAVSAGVVTHELAHAWEDNSGKSGQALSDRMRTVTESYGETKRPDFPSQYAWDRQDAPCEDFAEAVAGYFDGGGASMSPGRWNFVFGALQVEARRR